MCKSEESIHENIIKMKSDIQAGLLSIKTNENWLTKYKEWNRDELNQFESLLDIKDPLNLSCVGDNLIFDLESDVGQNDLEILKMSVFLSETLTDYSKSIFFTLRDTRNRNNKKKLIEQYFGVVDSIVDSIQLSPCIVLLNKYAEKQMALRGRRTIDLYKCFFSLKERLRKSSTESIYLLFTYWRLTRTKKDLKKLVFSIIDYIQTYYYDYDNDPDMQLYRSLDGLMIIKKLEIIYEWLKRIAYHTEQIAEKYKEMGWMYPIDRMADHIVTTNQISKYVLLQYKRLFEKDDDRTVYNKAVCYHGYGIWIKTVDVMYITREIFKLLYHLPEDDLKKVNASKVHLLDLYDAMDKVYGRFTSQIFYHKVYYDQERKNIDSLILETLEEDAELISESVDNVLDFTNAIAADDIDGLMLAKQKYVSSLGGFVTEEQIEKLDELSLIVTDKIKDAVQKKEIYDDIYSAVMDGFKAYATELIRYPNLFNTLASAEYLYKQYVEKREPNVQFDYSCISIMYYMALEDFVNKLVYAPYANDVLSKISKNTVKSKEFKNNEASKYVSSVNAFWDKKQRLKPTCEIGVLGYLLNGVEKEECFKDYIIKLYPGINILSLEKYGEELKTVAPRRNNAAHGGNYLTYNDVCTDKINVFDYDLEKYRGLIIEFLHLLF